MRHTSIVPRRQAFTLIEIMVAAAITIIMIGLVIQITGDVLKLWNRSMGKLSANAEARIAMELLTSDLEAALLVNNDQQWLRVEIEDDVGSPTAGQTVGLKLFTSALDRPIIKTDGSNEAGNICAVAYRLALAPAYSNAKTDTFVLFRALEGPTATFDELLGPADDDPQLSLSEDLPKPFWKKANILSPNNYLAGNVVDFKVYIYGVDDNGNEIILNDPDGNSKIEHLFAYGGTDSTDAVPQSAEIFLRIVSDEGLDILSLFADPAINGAGTGYDNVEQVILEHGEVFKRRVHFLAKPL